MAKVLEFSVAAEACTGLALVLAPSVVGALLLGAELSGVATIIARVFGLTLLSLCLACWPGRPPGRAATRGMSAYNLLIALELAYAGSADQADGVLLWPAVALHAIVGVLLVWELTRPTADARP